MICRLDRMEGGREKGKEILRMQTKIHHDQVLLRESRASAT